MKNVCLFRLTKNHVAAVLETSKSLRLQIFHSLTSHVRSNHYASSVGFWEVIFLAVLLKYEPQNKKGRLISLNIQSIKVGAMSILTTLDKHGESKTIDCPRYNGLIFRLDNFGVNCKYSILIAMIYCISCLDIKESLYTILN